MAATGTGLALVTSSWVLYSGRSSGPRQLHDRFVDRAVGWMLLVMFGVTSIAVVWLLRRLDRKNAMLAEAGIARQRVLEQEESQRERLREIDGLKDAFVTLAGHELRTPLTSIAGYVEMLLEDEERLEPDQLSFLHTIRRNSDRILRLADDLLELSRAETTGLSFDLRPMSLAPIANDAMQAHVADAAVKDITLTSSITARRRVVGDPARLRQAFDNLLSNAIKFTPAGGHVTVVLVDIPGEIVFTIRDSGIGVPEEERSQLFERFFRGSLARDTHVQGAGLGLAITKAIVTAHAGTIAVEPAEPGTSMIVRLPEAA